MLVIRPSGGEERTCASGLKPEGKGLILNVGAAHQVTVKGYPFILRNTERYTRLMLPGRSMRVQRRTGSFVHQDITRTLIHRIVRNQFALVAGQPVHVGLCYLIRTQRFGPEAYLHHVSIQIPTDNNRCINRRYLDEIYERRRIRIGYILRSDKETHSSGGMVIFGHKARKCSRGLG